MKSFFLRTTKERKIIGRCDILLIIVLLFICFLLCVPVYSKKDSVKAQVYSGSQLVREVDLSENDDNYTFFAGNCEIAVEGKEIFFKSSPCRDKICINAGRLSKSGQFSSCVPERVTIVLKGEKNKLGVDAVTY